MLAAILRSTTWTVDGLYSGGGRDADNFMWPERHRSYTTRNIYSATAVLTLFVNVSLVIVSVCLAVVSVSCDGEYVSCDWYCVSFDRECVSCDCDYHIRSCCTAHTAFIGC